MRYSKLRPSSHSTDYTVVGVCDDEATTKLLSETLFPIIKRKEKSAASDWERPELVTRGNRVIFSVNTNSEGTLTKITDALEQDAKIEQYMGYQEIVLRIPIPKGLTPKTLPLLFSPAEVTIIRYVMRHSKRLSTPNNGEGIAEFFYRGRQIFDVFSQEIRYADQNGFKLPPSWNIQILYDSSERWTQH